MCTSQSPAEEQRLVVSDNAMAVAGAAPSEARPHVVWAGGDPTGTCVPVALAGSPWGTRSALPVGRLRTSAFISRRGQEWTRQGQCWLEDAHRGVGDAEADGEGARAAVPASPAPSTCSPSARRLCGGRGRARPAPLCRTSGAACCSRSGHLGLRLSLTSPSPPRRLTARRRPHAAAARRPARRSGSTLDKENQDDTGRPRPAACDGTACNM